MSKNLSEADIANEGVPLQQDGDSFNFGTINSSKIEEKNLSSMDGSESPKSQLLRSEDEDIIKQIRRDIIAKQIYAIIERIEEEELFKHRQEGLRELRANLLEDINNPRKLYENFLQTLEEKEREELNKLLQENKELQAKLNQISIDGFKKINTSKNIAPIQDVKWESSTSNERSTIIKNASGEEVCTLKETNATITLADGSIAKIRSVEFPKSVNGELNLSMIARDANGKNMPEDKAIYFSAHYDKSGKLMEVTAPPNIQFEGKGDNAIGYIEHEGTRFYLAVTQGKYKEMLQEVAKNNEYGLSPHTLESLEKDEGQDKVEIISSTEEVVRERRNAISEPEELKKPVGKSIDLDFDEQADLRTSIISNRSSIDSAYSENDALLSRRNSISSIDSAFYDEFGDKTHADLIREAGEVVNESNASLKKANDEVQSLSSTSSENSKLFTQKPFLQKVWDDAVKFAAMIMTPLVIMKEILTNIKNNLLGKSSSRSDLSTKPTEIEMEDFSSNSQLQQSGLIDVNTINRQTIALPEIPENELQSKASSAPPPPEEPLYYEPPENKKTDEKILKQVPKARWVEDKDGYGVIVDPTKIEIEMEDFSATKLPSQNLAQDHIYENTKLQQQDESLLRKRSSSVSSVDQMKNSLDNRSTSMSKSNSISPPPNLSGHQKPQEKLKKD